MQAVGIRGYSDRLLGRYVNGGGHRISVSSPWLPMYTTLFAFQACSNGEELSIWMPPTMSSRESRHQSFGSEAVDCLKACSQLRQSYTSSFAGGASAAR